MNSESKLEEELAFIEKNKPKYLKEHNRFFVLVKGSQLLGVFPTAEDVYKAGLNKVGLEPFPVKQMIEKEPMGYVPLLSIDQSVTDSDAGIQ